MANSDYSVSLDRLARRGVPCEVAPGLTVPVVNEEDLLEALRHSVPGGERDSDRTAARRGLEIAALKAGMSPRRYVRNLGTLGLEGQARLLETTVGIAGLGGLGGVVSELLARAGVGRLVLIDPDTISEDNLNRQILATGVNVGQAKVEAARKRLALVSPATGVITHRLRAKRDDFARLFREAAVVVDALDDTDSRFALQDAAASLGVPLVHGAVAGLSGQVSTIFPGDTGLSAIYGPRDQAPRQGVEAMVGNPSPTPAMIASIQAQEVLKLASGVGRPLRHKLLLLDLLTGYTAVVDL